METSLLIKNQFSTINNYRYLERIGEGGYGLVFKAEQLSTSQTVAIKTIKFKDGISKQKKNQQLARFERETKLCAEINHPNIVQLLDKGYSGNGEPYAVFEYIEGETLKEFILQNNGLLAPEMAVLMGQVLDALVCAHAKGIVHRDLKPHNIMVSKLGSKYYVKILDFGIGAFTHDFRSVDYQSLTVTQDVLGTPTYSAPEQLRGEAPTVKSDLYAWGLIVIECLTGKPVMDGGSIAEVFQQQLMPSNVPIPPAIVGHDLAHLLRRVLEKNPRNRAENVESIFKEFEQINFNTLTGNIAIQRKVTTSFEEVTIGNDMVWSGISGSRKQLTVLCLKLNVEIANDVHLDIEILDAIQKDQLNLCKDTAIRYGGHVSGTFMNNLAVYFGYPESNDTDARRAGRTALELVTEIKKRSTLMLAQHGVTLSIQIGVHTGTVLVKRNHTPEGNVPNIAFDLVHKAAPGNVLVSASSKKLLAQFLEFEKVEANDISNTTEVLKIFKLVGERQTEALSSLRPWSATREMIGRDDEQTELLKLWELANDKGNAIIINGQAGIGKSKLTHEVKKEVRSVGRVVRECRCLPEHQNNALYPFFNMLRNHWGIVGIEDKNLVIQKVKNALNNVGCTKKSSFALLCSWLSISLPEEYVISQATPEEQKKLLFHILKQCILQIDRENPFLLVVEDLHWLDPTSTEFIQYLLSDLEDNQYFLVMTTRPVFENPWKYDYLSQINLETLPKNAIQLLVEGVLGGESISNKTLNYIEKRADGIPLFIEELTSMLLEQKYIQLENKVYELVESSIDMVPMTLQDLLNARLDRLSLAKETAQLAAAIGREFSYELLVKSSVKDEATAQSDLNLLMNSDLIYRQRRVQGENYIFRHALIRDAAYDGMTESSKKEIHSNIAITLEDSFPNQVEENPFEIARHYGSGTEYKKAIKYGAIAAKGSLDRSADFEVLEYTNLLLEWISKLDESMADYDDNLNVHCIRTNALMNKYGWSTEEVQISALKAYELIQERGFKGFKLSNIISAYWALFTYYHVASDRDKVDTLTIEFSKLSELSNDKGLGLSSTVLRGIHLFNSGDLKNGIKILESVKKYMDGTNMNEPTYIVGIENFCWAISYLGQALWQDGKKNEARKEMDWALDRAKKIDHAPTICLMLFYRGIVYQWDKDKKSAKIATDEAIAIADKYNLLGYRMYASTINDWASDKIEPIDETINQLQMMGCNLALTNYLSLPAELEFKNGDVEKAISRIDRCLELCEENKEYFYQKELLKLKASFKNY